MKTKLRFAVTQRAALLLLLWTFNVQLSTVFAQVTVFTYQGRLESGGAPFNGNAEFQPTLWNAVSGGAQMAANSPATVAVGVTNGLFVLALEFGAAPFAAGGDRWLQLEVRTGNDPFTLLSPRQRLTPAPYAITAAHLTGPLPASQLTGALPSANFSGVYSAAVTFDNSASSFSGNGAGLTSLNANQLASGTVPDARLAPNMVRTNQAWLLSGNAGTTPGAHSLGTTDDRPLEFKINGIRALRLELGGDSTDEGTVPDGAPNVIGGAPVNFVAPGVVGATIGGGGATNYSTLEERNMAFSNSVSGDFGTISGGLRNTLQSGKFNTIGGGFGNRILSTAIGSTIVGGQANWILTNSYFSIVSGGHFNIIAPNSDYSGIGAGSDNSIGSDYSGIGAGYGNDIRTNSEYSTIGGGEVNSIRSNSRSSVISGGAGNRVMTNSSFATIPGGFQNAATNYAFAAGSRAKAGHTGTFVWADAENADFSSTSSNQFLVRAAGGVGINSTNTEGGLTLADSDWRKITMAAPGVTEKLRLGGDGIVGNMTANAWWTGNSWQRDDTGSSSLAYLQHGANNQHEFRVSPPGSGAIAWNTAMVIQMNGNVGIGIAPTNKLHVAGGVSARAFVNTSDRNAKENFTLICAREVLAKVVALPITQWSFKDMPGARHIGPTAQDFYAAFGLGASDTTITTVDPDGVALAAIQGLNQKVDDESAALRAEIKRRDAENAELRVRLSALEKLVGNFNPKGN